MMQFRLFINFSRTSYSFHLLQQWEKCVGGGVTVYMYILTDVCLPQSLTQQLCYFNRMMQHHLHCPSWRSLETTCQTVPGRAFATTVLILPSRCTAHLIPWSQGPSTAKLSGSVLCLVWWQKHCHRRWCFFSLKLSRLEKEPTQSPACLTLSSTALGRLLDICMQITAAARTRIVPCCKTLCGMW